MTIITIYEIHEYLINIIMDDIICIIISHINYISHDIYNYNIYIIYLI